MQDAENRVANEEIDRLLEAWAKAIEAADLDAIVALVTADAEFWSNGAPPLVGREALRSAMAALFERFRLSQGFDRAELVIRDDLAFLRGTERNTLRPLDGGEPITRVQRAFSLMRRDPDGTWRFWRGMTNLPPEGDG